MIDSIDSADLTTKIRTALAPCSLGHWPTALEAAPALAAKVGASDVWLKREDQSSTLAGGNKVRGLEFLLSSFGAGDVALTLGGWGSTHCLATARHAKALGRLCVVARFPQGMSDGARGVAAATQASAAASFSASDWIRFPFALVSAWRAAGRLGRRRWIPGGGARADAVVGHALGALELAAQMSSPPDAIVTPLGSGGTAAGLMLGMAILGWRTQIVAVRVAPRIVANRRRVLSLCHGARRLLGRKLERLPTPHSSGLMVADALGAGYGHPSPAGETAREWAREAGLSVDSTYGGKALSVLPDLATRGLRRLVFWNTFAPPTG
jgi:1-aminocyclopropane-1-carboxylate deaminase/D-cysteine desulfhydrase-like pyridoxal-dependent ACC family enzyme